LARFASFVSESRHSPVFSECQHPALSTSDCEHFLKHGYVIVHEVTPPDVIARAVEALEADGESQAATDAVAA